MSHPNQPHQGGWTTPAPAGLTAFAVACVTFFAVLTGRVPHSATPMLACWLMGGFVVQLCVGLIELRGGHMLGGNVFLFFSGFFMLAGGLEFFVEWISSINGYDLSTSIGGWAWLVLMVTLLLWGPCYMKTSSTVLGLTLITLNIGVICVTIHKLMPGDATFNQIAGWALLVTGILGIYQAAAMQINDAWGRTVLPVGGPLIKSKAAAK